MTQEWTTFQIPHPAGECRVPAGTILLAYRGSIAHGMYVPKSDPDSIDDVDLMGVVLAPPECYLGLTEWGSRGTMDYFEGQYDCVFYEIRKAVSLLLQGNPNIVSLLWLRPEHYLQVSPAGRRLIESRSLFVGKHLHDAFAGYAHAQLEKMETRDPAELREYIAITNELKHRGLHPNHKGERVPYPAGHNAGRGEGLSARQSGDEVLLGRLRRFLKKGENIGYMGDKRKQLVLRHGYDAKNAAHLIRLLRMAKGFLETGELEVHRSDAAELLEIKAGRWDLARVKAHADELFRQVGDARDASRLPEGPDRAGAERLLVSILREHLCAADPKLRAG